MLRVILSKLEIGPENTCFFGSSGGGTTSIMLATMLHSKVTAINPQLDVFDYFTELGPSRSLEKNLLKQGECIIKERLDVFGLFKKERYLPQIHLLENLKSELDISRQLIPFIDKLQKEKINYKGMLRVDFYNAEGGHGAMPTKEETLAAIEEDIKRELTDGYFISFEVETWLEGNKLHTKVNLHQEGDGLDFAYYLYRGKSEIVAKLLPYTKSTQCMFELPDSGAYHVRVFVRSNAGSPSMFIRAKDSNEVSYETEKK